MVRFDVLTVKKAKAKPLDSRFRGNDGGEVRRNDDFPCIYRE